MLENDNFKKIIKNSFGKAKTIKDYYDILIRINEHEFGRINNPKIDSKDKTDLLNKIGQIKTIITPSDNVLANDSGIKMIINETILDLKNSLDYLEKNEVQNKKSELDELIKKLTELKKEIDDLKSTDVLEYSKTRKELAKKLAKSKDDQSIEDTKLYIKKAKLKKKASELPYPNGVDSVAIYEINSRIDSTKKDNLKSIEDLISKLPKKINEAKELIAQISESGKDINGQRTKDLNNQLSRSVDDEDFDKLKENIQKAKNQSDDYKKDLARRLKDQVNSLHYPKDARAKENLKAQIDKLSDEELETFSHTIDEIAKNVESVKSSIESIPKRNKDDERAIDEFNKIFSTADNVKKLKDLKKLVDNYNDIANRLNSFTLYNAPEIYQEDLVTANNALNELKSSLWSKLSMLTRFNSQQDLRKLIDADYELYKETKKLNGDILVAAQFLNEAKSKANVKDVSIIKNKIQPYKNQLNRFWTADKGDYLRQNIDQWFTSISEDESNITNPDQYRFLSYKLLLKKLRTRQNDEQVKKIVDDEVEQYKALIEFKRVYDNTNSSIPENVKKSLKAKILNVPENATKADMDLITKYLGQRVETNNKVISGFYLDAKQLLDFVLKNNSGKESNKAHFQSLFNDIGVATSGQNYDTEITAKIDNFRKEINTFISKLKEVKEKIKNLTNIVTTADKKVIFENELAKADYKDFDNLINIINK
ncbi:hypothetical protein OM999_01670 [Mycoplasmopsis cynos]|uniref:hypothetical protein n=1 Tax=Mycoplasmopsis cynos TaxID=171284 RepID=UPI0024CCB295|nr:hypothetical protein OM999_01670 [Mycoplasmopsis cynos]